MATSDVALGGWTLDRKLCDDPRHLLQQCAERGLSTAWAGQANLFDCSEGCKPGHGCLILSREDLDALRITGTADRFRKLVIGKTTFPKILVSGPAQDLTPGADGDDATAYLLPIADKRWLYYQRGEPVRVIYNWRDHTTGDYQTGTLNSGAAWTWQEIVDDLWPSALGAVPDLPFTPDGTPEGFFYHGCSRLEALEDLLIRLACTLRYDLVGDTFDIVRLGDSADADGAGDLADSLADAGLAILDDHLVFGRTATYPEFVRCEFRVAPVYSNGALPIYSIDTSIAASVPNSAISPGTYVILRDDMYARQSANAVTNVATLTTRAAERAADWLRKRQYHDTQSGQTYSGMAAEWLNALGANVSTVIYEDIGAGMTTRVGSSGVDTLMEWRWPDMGEIPVSDDDCEPWGGHFGPECWGSSCGCCCGTAPGGTPATGCYVCNNPTGFPTWRDANGVPWARLADGSVTGSCGTDQSGLGANGPSGPLGTWWEPRQGTGLFVGCLLWIPHSWNENLPPTDSSGNIIRPPGGINPKPPSGFVPPIWPVINPPTRGDGGSGVIAPPIIGQIGPPKLIDPTPSGYPPPPGKFLVRNNWQIPFGGTDFGGGVLLTTADGAGGVSSFNTRTGAVTLTAADVQAVGALTGEVSPSAITANKDDYNTGAGRLIRLATDGGSYDVTGIAISQAAGWQITIVNLTALTVITLKHNVTSTAANRFQNKGSSDIMLTSISDPVNYLYDATTARWRQI